MTDKKEFILKLIRLANNNPNENEANLAARKACKLIEESKILEVGSKPIINMGTPPSDWEGFKPHPKQEEFYRGQWNSPGSAGGGKTRTNEWQESERQRKTKEDFFRRDYREQEKATEERFNRYREGSWEPVDYGVDFGGPFKSPKERHQEKRNLTCKKCKETKSTSFVGLEEAFICNKCQWEAYLYEEKRK